MTPHDAQAILDKNFAPWVLALHPKITTISTEGAILDIPITDQITRMGDIVSGQTMAALADTAMVFACFGALGKLEPVATVTLDTQFLRPGQGETLRATATVTRTGRTMIFTRCVLTTWPNGKEVAHVTASFARPS